MIKYDKYKPSGVEWIGEIPEHWDISLLKYTLSNIIGGGTPDTNIDSYWTYSGGVPWVSIADITKSNNYLTCTEKQITQDGLKSKGLVVVPQGTLLLSIFASLGKTTILGINAAINQAILGLLCANQLDQGFLRNYLLFIEDYIGYYSSSNTQENLNLSKIKNLPLSLPPLKEQQAIAAYLDEKCRAIDAMIERKERLLELYAEKRQAIINRAVTRGIDPSAPMRDSGIPWLGLIPAHWQVKKLKMLSKIGDGLHGTPDYNENGDYYFINGNNIGNKAIILTDKTFKVDTEEYLKYRIYIDDNTILISLNGTIGSLSFYNNEPIVLSKSAGYIKLSSSINKFYVYYLLQSNYIRTLFELSLSGTTIKNLSLDTLRNTVILQPNDAEQSAIVSHIEAKCVIIDKITEKLRKQIDLYKEYRTALIANAVTGKIKVIK